MALRDTRSLYPGCEVACVSLGAATLRPGAAGARPRLQEGDRLGLGAQREHHRRRARPFSWMKAMKAIPRMFQFQELCQSEVGVVFVA